MNIRTDHIVSVTIILRWLLHVDYVRLVDWKIILPALKGDALKHFWYPPLEAFHFDITAQSQQSPYCRSSNNASNIIILEIFRPLHLFFINKRTHRLYSLHFSPKDPSNHPYHLSNYCILGPSLLNFHKQSSINSEGSLLSITGDLFLLFIDLLKEPSFSIWIQLAGVGPKKFV